MAVFIEFLLRTQQGLYLARGSLHLSAQFFQSMPRPDGNFGPEMPMAATTKPEASRILAAIPQTSLRHSPRLIE